jgi:hypothetical protein
MPNRKLNWIVPTLPRFAALTLVALCSWGCAPPSIVGDWYSSGFVGTDGSVRYTFRKDGTYTSKVSVTNPSLMMELSATAIGTYQIKNDRVTTKVSDFKLDGLPDEMKNKLPREARRRLNRPLKAYMQWINPDQFTLIEENSGTVIRVRRVKEGV